MHFMAFKFKFADRQTGGQSPERFNRVLWSTGTEVDTCSHGAEVCGCVSVCVWKQSDWEVGGVHPVTQ